MTWVMVMTESNQFVFFFNEMIKKKLDDDSKGTKQKKKHDDLEKKFKVQNWMKKEQKNSLRQRDRHVT